MTKNSKVINDAVNQLQSSLSNEDVKHLCKTIIINVKSNSVSQIVKHLLIQSITGDLVATLVVKSVFSESQFNNFSEEINILNSSNDENEKLIDTKIMASRYKSAYIDNVKNHLQYTNEFGAVLVPKKVSDKYYQFVNCDNLDKLVKIFVEDATKNINRTSLIVDTNKYYTYFKPTKTYVEATDISADEVQTAKEVEKEQKKQTQQFKQEEEAIKNLKAKGVQILDSSVILWDDMTISEKVQRFLTVANELGVKLTDCQKKRLFEKIQPNEETQSEETQSEETQSAETQSEGVDVA